MYTQCPDCATVFRVTAEALRAAQGDVRCGVCSTTFNALENLSEQAFTPEPAAEAPSPEDSMTVEELPGGESIELSEPDEAESMEFHGDAAELERLFVVEDPAVAPIDPDRDLESTDEHPIIVLEERDDPDAAGSVESIVLETAPAIPAPAIPAPLPPAPLPPAPTQSAAASTGHTAPRILIPEEMRRRLAEEAAARAAAVREFEEVDDDSPGLLSGRWPWVAAVALLALLLVMQVVHAARNDLVRSPTLGPLIAGAYSFFGLAPLAPTDLSSYELRQWGAASDPREADRLMLRASIFNRAGYAQPFPLLRLTLQDRFGGTLGQRDIGPADYLPGTGAAGLLEPGQRADALIRIVDPGSEAVGFELDICLPAKGGVRCANQIKTARQ